MKKIIPVLSALLGMMAFLIGFQEQSGLHAVLTIDLNEILKKLWKMFSDRLVWMAWLIKKQLPVQA